MDLTCWGHHISAVFNGNLSDKTRHFTESQKYQPPPVALKDNSGSLGFNLGDTVGQSLQWLLRYSCPDQSVEPTNQCCHQQLLARLKMMQQATTTMLIKSMFVLKHYKCLHIQTLMVKKNLLYKSCNIWDKIFNTFVSNFSVEVVNVMAVESSSQSSFFASPLKSAK